MDQSEEISIEVTEEGIEFDIETDSDVGTAPLTVEFTARLSDEDLPGPFYFQWDFGDGARDVSNPTTSHVPQAGRIHRDGDGDQRARTAGDPRGRRSPSILPTRHAG